MRSDGRFDILGEVRIDSRCGVGGEQSDALADLPARRWRCFDDCHRAVVLFHDHLDAFLDLGQYGVNIPSEFGFCNTDRRHASIITRLFAGRPGPLLLSYCDLTCP